MYSDFSTWWAALTFFHKIYWIIALPFSLIFVIQLVMSFFIGDTDHDMSGHADVSVDHDTGIPFQFITLKNLVAFFTILGWSGLACLNASLGHWETILISVAAGLLMMVIMASIFYFMSKLTESGNMNIENALNKTGTAYLPIPAARTGMGKVQLKVQSSTHELDAITDDTEDIKTGTSVIVTEILGNHVLLVKRI
jgi:membrane protein implicated in regulation of membrane protease activity